MQRDDAGLRCEFMQARVNRGVEEFAASVGATCLGDGNFAVLDGELSDDALSEIAEALFRALDAEESERADR